MAVRMCAMSAIMQDVMGFVNSLGLGNSNILGGPGGNGGGNGTGGSSGNGDGNYGYVDKEHSICNPEFAALAQGCLNLMVTLYDRTGVSEKVIESLDFVETYVREGNVSQQNLTGLAAAAIKPVRFRLNGMDDISEEIIENIDNANWDDVVEWVGENVEYQSASQMKKATFKVLNCIELDVPPFLVPWLNSMQRLHQYCELLEEINRVIFHNEIWYLRYSPEVDEYLTCLFSTN